MEICSQDGLANAGHCEDVEKVTLEDGDIDSDEELFEFANREEEVDNNHG